MVTNHHWNTLREYAAELLKVAPNRDGFTLPLTVRGDYVRQPKAFMAYHQYQNRPVEWFLNQFPFYSLLLGSPGAGKSHALRTSAVSWARKILSGEGNLSEPTDVSHFIPIYVDLKCYAGSLERMVAPLIKNFQLAELMEAGSTSFLIDSYNEAPRQYFENGRLKADLAKWIGKAKSSRWIIASRTDEALEFFEGERFRIEDIEVEFVRRHLSDLNVDLGLRHADDLIRLLQKPIYFSAFIKHRLTLEPGGTHPARAIESMIDSYSTELQNELQVAPELTLALGDLAVQAIDRGEELLARTQVVAAVESHLATDNAAVRASQIVDRIVKSGLMLKFDRNHIAFYHQSITELIAAKQVAGQIAIDSNVIDRLLTSTRWDAAFHLVTHYLDPETNRLFFERLIAADVKLAIRCIRFSEFNRHQLVAQMLDVILQWEPEYRHYDWPFLYAVKTLPVDSAHTEQLLRLLKYPVGKGGTAAILLARAIGEAAIDPIMNEVFARPREHGLGQDAGQALVDLMTPDRVASTMDRILACELPADTSFSASSIVAFFENAFQKINPGLIAREFRARGLSSPALIEVICQWGKTVKQDWISLDLMVEILSQELSKAVFSLYLRAKFDMGPHAVLELVDQRCRDTFCNALLHCLKDVEAAKWTVQLIALLVDADTSLNDWLNRTIDGSTGVARLALLSIAGNSRSDEFWEATEELIQDQERRFTDVEYELLHVLQDVEWEGRESLVLRLFERGDAKLTMCALPPQGLFLNVQVGWSWVERLLPAIQAAIGQGSTVEYHFPEFLWNHADDDYESQVVAEFNLADSSCRDLLADWFLLQRKGLASSHFTEESLAYLVERLHRIQLEHNRPDLLGNIVTEDMVQRLLMPRLSETSKPFHTNLRIVLENAGKRHHRRYS